MAQQIHESDVLFLVDYPAPHDDESGVICSSIHDRRTVFLHRLMREHKLDPSKISVASVLRCNINSKSIMMSDYRYCSDGMVEDMIIHGIRYVVCFGSVAGSIMTGQTIKSIDDVAGRIIELPETGVFCVVTYALSILSNPGCSSCGGNVHFYIMHKHIGLLLKKRDENINNRRTL